MASNLLGPIIKLSGAGNTFAMVDARLGSKWRELEGAFKLNRKDIVKLVCDVKCGLAADGFLFLETGSPGFDFDWDFYNSDGSTAEMCGNAARCAAFFCKEYLQAETGKDIKFKTGAGLVSARFIDLNRIEVKMPPAIVTQLKRSFNTTTMGSQQFMCFNTGVPHMVQELSKSFEYLPLKEMAQEVRNHIELQPAGSNVTFFSEIEPGKIKAVTFERGVEGFTSACGTGAVAAALGYSLGHEKLPRVQVEMPGGELVVSFEKGFEFPQLIGDAVLIGEYKFNLEVLTCKN